MATIPGSGGNDSLEGTSGDDSITGGAGHDTINSQGGADSIDAGSGDDTVVAGSGANTVTGGAGNDSIEGGDDGNTFSGEAGDDSLRGGGGADTLYGGAGSDTLYGHDGPDVLDAGDGADTVFAGFGDDTVEGGAGDDDIYGDLGNDLIFGGSGNDSILGQDGSDTIVGATGNDTLLGGTGADVFVVTPGSGSNVIEDFTPGEGDVVAINYPGINTFADLAPYLSDDGNFGTLVTLPDGSVTQIRWLPVGSANSTHFVFGVGPVCLLRGMAVETPAGPRPVETLAPGDLVLTRDHGAQPIRRTGHRSYRFPRGPHRMKPIRLRPGLFAPGCPSREVLVSPQHRIGLPQPDPDRLVPACKLRRRDGVTARPHCRIAHYHYLLLDRHELVQVHGLWLETLLLTPYSARALGLPPEARPGAPLPPARPLRDH